MKARMMVLERFGAPLVPREIDIPPLESGQTLVRLEAAGVCGSDVHIWKGEDPRAPLPLVLGHEGVGAVVDTAGDVRTVDGRSLVPGDPIIWNRGISCKRCRFCAVFKEPSLCPDRRVYGISIPADEPPGLNGCYADHIVLRAGTDIFDVPLGIDADILVSASCSGATVAHAFDMLDTPLTGMTVAVQGPGPLGMYAAAFARSLGAEHVIVIGGTASRLALCETFGATVTLNRRELSEPERLDIVRGMTGGRGADVVVEAAGTNGAALEGIRLLRKGGTLLSVGYSQPAGTEAVDFYRDIVARNATVRGVWVSDARHLSMALSLVASDPERFGAMVTHRFSLDRADEALVVMEKHEAVKAVLVFDE